MSGDGPVTLEVLRRMMQRVLDQLDVARLETRQMKRELARIDRALTSLQHADLDRLDAVGDLEEKMEGLSRRIERVEDGR